MEDFTEEEKSIAGHMKAIIGLLGVNQASDGMRDTPKRWTKAWREMLLGYDQDPGEILARDFAVEYDQMVVCRDISFHSTCEHHLLPFYGVAHVAYIPGKRVVGLSKMARLVDCFARRFQIQERLTAQIADAMAAHLRPKGVAVMVQARHMCMACRGVRKQDASMVTTALKGEFRKAAVRAEFYSQVK